VIAPETSASRSCCNGLDRKDMRAFYLHLSKIFQQPAVQQ
jgi:hypothetical protein